MTIINNHDLPSFFSETCGGSQYPYVEKESVSIASIGSGDSPRLEGQNRDHAKLLAEVDGPLPPIIVHRPTMTVIDGMHRLTAARLRNQLTIDVQFFDGNAEEAFVVAVWANVSHGRPLSLADRKAAALRIFRAYPNWSDRRVARAAGLSHRTAAMIRKCAGGQDLQSNTRIGIDGRCHPLTNWDGREAAAEIIRADETASLRDVAKQAGVSPGTVRDVRSRLQRGEEPVPLRKMAGSSKGNGCHEIADRDRNGSAPSRRPLSDESRTLDWISRRALERLRADPAVRLSSRGRALIRALAIGVGALREIELLAAMTPGHCRSTVAGVATALGEEWLALAAAVADS